MWCDGRGTLGSTNDGSTASLYSVRWRTESQCNCSSLSGWKHIKYRFLAWARPGHCWKTLYRFQRPLRWIRYPPFTTRQCQRPLILYCWTTALKQPNWRRLVCLFTGNTSAKTERTFTTGPPNGPVLFCWLASVVCHCRLSSVTLLACGPAGRRARRQ